MSEMSLRERIADEVAMAMAMASRGEDEQPYDYADRILALTEETNEPVGAAVTGTGALEGFESVHLFGPEDIEKLRNLSPDCGLDVRFLYAEPK